MTEQNEELDLETDVRRRAASWGPHSIRFTGPPERRQAACSCGAWARPVGAQSADAVVEEYDGHVARLRDGNQTGPVWGPSAPRPSSQQSQITNLFIGGVALFVVCGAISLLLLQQNDSDNIGATLFLIATSLLAWGGQLMVLVAVIAWGVRLGTAESARRSQS